MIEEKPFNDGKTPIKIKVFEIKGKQEAWSKTDPPKTSTNYTNPKKPRKVKGSPTSLSLKENFRFALAAKHIIKEKSILH